MYYSIRIHYPKNGHYDIYDPKRNYIGVDRSPIHHRAKGRSPEHTPLIGTRRPSVGGILGSGRFLYRGPENYV